MKKHLFFIYLFCISAIFISACEEEGPEVQEPQSAFEGGVFIVNEGVFGQPNGSLGFYDPADGATVQNIVEKQNGGVPVGASIMSVHHSEDELFIITNGPDKVEVVTSDSLFYKTDPIAGADISTPREMTTFNGKGYISCWGPWSEDYTLPDSYVAVVDLETYSVIKKIDVHDGAQGILAFGDRIFVAGSYSTHVTVIDPSSDTVTDSIQTPYGPTSLAIDANSKLWTVCTGGALVRIDPSSLEVEENLTIEGNAPTGRMALSDDKNTIYYVTSGGWENPEAWVYELGVTDGSTPESPLISGRNFYAIGFDTERRDIYIGAYEAFADPGYVLIYEPDGTKTDSLAAGIAPNSFIFF